LTMAASAIAAAVGVSEGMEDPLLPADAAAGAWVGGTWVGAGVDAGAQAPTSNAKATSVVTIKVVDFIFLL
jgi:hypothetical protein